MGFSKISNGGLNLGNLWGFQLIALQFMLSKLLGFFFPVTFRDLQAVTGTPQGTLPSPPPLSLTAHLLARLSPSCLPELHMTQSSLSFSWDYLEAVPPHNYSNRISFEFTKITPFALYQCHCYMTDIIGKLCAMMQCCFFKVTFAQID